MMQSMVSGVVAVMMVIDLHKGVWWEEEQEGEREAGGGYDGCVTAWVQSEAAAAVEAGRARQSLPKWKIEWRTLLAARVLASDGRPSDICLC